MWIIIAVVCTALNVNQCIPMIWPHAYISEEQCVAAQPDALAHIPDGVAYAYPRCVQTPGQDA